MDNRYFPYGIQGPQVDTADPQGGIGVPVQRLYERPLWQSPAVQGPPHNLPAPGDRLRLRGPNLIGGVASGGSAPQQSGLQGTQMVRIRHQLSQLIEAPFNVGVQSVKVLDQPQGIRNHLILSNRSPGAQVLFVSFGSQASTLSVLRLTAGQSIMFDEVVPQNEVYAISDIAGGILSVAYAQYVPV